MGPYNVVLALLGLIVPFYLSVSPFRKRVGYAECVPSKYTSKCETWIYIGSQIRVCCESQMKLEAFGLTLH